MKIWIDDEEEKDIDSSQELLEKEPEEDNSDRCIVHAILFELAFGAVLYLKSATAAFSYLIALAPLVVSTGILGSICYKKNGDMKLFRAICCMSALGIGLQYLIDAKYNPVSEFSLIKFCISILLSIVFLIFYGMIQKGLKYAFSVYLCMGISVSIYIVLYFFGYDPNGYGTNAWINIHGLTLQLTDFTKVCALFFYSSLFSCKYKENDTKVLFLSSIFFLLNLSGSLLIHELGSFFILFFLHLVMLFMFLPHSFKKVVYILSVFIACFMSVALSFILYKALLPSYQSGTMSPLISKIWPFIRKIYERFSITANINNDPYGAGYQLLQAKKSLWMAGFFGNTVNFNSLPVAESDMAFVAMVSQLGWITGFIYLYLLCRVTCLGLRYTRMRIVKYRDEAIVVFGATIMLFLQAILVILGSCNILPLTGLPIPFLSRGSTYMTIVYCFIALILRSSCDKKEDYEDEQ